MKTQYVSTLSKEVQTSIKEDLKAQGIGEEDIEVAIDSRLCDLEDTIDIRKYI